MKTLLVFFAISIFILEVFYAYPISIGLNFNLSETSLNIIKGIRLPRFFITFLAGLSFTLAGLLVQKATRNDLASPTILGINSFGSFIVCLYLSFSHYLFPIPLSLIAVLGSGLGAVLLFSLNRAFKTNDGQDQFILVGIALGLFASSLTQAIVILDEGNLQSLLYWLLGGVDGKSWNEVFVLSIFSVPVYLGSLFLSPHLQVLLLGDDVAQSLGLNPKRIRNMVYVMVILLISGSLATTGPIAFVGLLFPHLAKHLFDENSQDIFIFGPLLGGLSLVFCDWLSRLIHFPFETPIGMISGILGGAYFLYLSFRRGKYAFS